MASQGRLIKDVLEEISKMQTSNAAAEEAKDMDKVRFLREWLVQLGRGWIILQEKEIRLMVAQPGAEALPTLFGSALESEEFQPTDKTTIGVHLYAILKAQVQQLPVSFLQLGYIWQTAFSSIGYLDGFVCKRIASPEAWPAERTDFMTRVYRDIVGCPYLIQASNVPKKRGRNSEYVVHLVPIGLPIGHGTSLTDQAGLKTCIRILSETLHFLTLLNKVLHQVCRAFETDWWVQVHAVGRAGVALGHTDIRWENIMQLPTKFVLIDLEFACELGQVPFTPAGHNRKIRPATYLQAWTAMCDLVLIGGLLASNGVPDLSSDRQHLKRSLQASDLTVQQALDHDWFADCML